MSFDVFLHGFVNGEPVLGGGVQMSEVLEPFIVRQEPDGRFSLVEYGDGMMANHISGEEPWELLVKGAAAPGWVVMPVGCPTCLTEEAQRADLPESIREDAVVIATGADLLRIIRSS